MGSFLVGAIKVRLPSNLITVLMFFLSLCFLGLLQAVYTFTLTILTLDPTSSKERRDKNITVDSVDPQSPTLSLHTAFQLLRIIEITTVVIYLMHDGNILQCPKNPSHALKGLTSSVWLALWHGFI